LVINPSYVSPHPRPANTVLEAEGDMTVSAVSVSTEVLWLVYLSTTVALATVYAVTIFIDLVYFSIASNTFTQILLPPSFPRIDLASQETLSTG
jgi:hypothetical protein